MAATTKGDGFKVSRLFAKKGLSIGGSGVPGSAANINAITKATTGLTDTVATAVATVTVPNAQNCATLIVEVMGVMGAGGAVGAGETIRFSHYQLGVARTAGLAAVATLSALIGGVQSKVAGADNITSVTVTASAMTGANSASQTFTINVAITKAAGAADAHTAVTSIRVLNQRANSGGITVA